MVGCLVLASGTSWWTARTYANALFGGGQRWTATYGAAGLVVETPEGQARLAYADLTDHDNAGGLHSWCLPRRRRLFLPAALVPPEAVGWIDSGIGPSESTGQ